MSKHRSSIARDLRTPKYRKRIQDTKLQKVRDSRKPVNKDLAEWLIEIAEEDEQK